MLTMLTMLMRLNYKRLKISSNSFHNWNLTQWLEWQEQLHPVEIDLGLERVATVRERLGIPAKLPFRTVIVAGTNGKGSTIAYLDAILRTAGYRTAVYTSPHILRYEERLAFSGELSQAQGWCNAFCQVNKARESLSLTYFEFSTLAALYQMINYSPDVAILEVGLGGRLDAVNIIDADVAVITTIQLDHCDWLGTTLEQIGYEKAGIVRPSIPLVYADYNPPRAILERCQELNAPCFEYGKEYFTQQQGDSFSLTYQLAAAEPICLEELPAPLMFGAHQYKNASAAWLTLQLLNLPSELSKNFLIAALSSVKVAGRCEVLPGPFSVVLDVAHNVDALVALAEFIRNLHTQSSTTQGRTKVVFGMMRRKNLVAGVAALSAAVDEWIVPEMALPEMYNAKEIEAEIYEQDAGVAIRCVDSFSAAVDLALNSAEPGDIVVVCGSFNMVEAWYRLRGISPLL